MIKLQIPSFCQPCIVRLQAACPHLHTSFIGGWHVGGGDYWENITGINTPLSALPPVVQTIGSLLPVTHGLLAVRALIDGASYASVLPLVAAELLIALVYSAVAWLMFGYRLRVTRQRGTFELT